jgi:S1-C subfamily serine protease
MARRTRLIRFLAALALLLATGCASLFLPSDRDRDISWRPYATKTVGDVRLEEYLSRRCGLVIRTIVSVRPEAGGFVIEESGLGTAAAIAPDGYWLTAAHCVTEPYPHVITTIGNERHIAPARIVWAGDPDDELRDLAILKTEQRLPWIFDWGDLEEIRQGAPLAGAGYGGRDEHTVAHVFGGHAREHPTLEMNGLAPRTALVVGDLPFVPGDSGGPLVTPRGGLLAVNTRIRVSVVGSPTSLSVAPDREWVERMIAQDRRAAALGTFTR